jgi:hypothetical protein
MSGEGLLHPNIQNQLKNAHKNDSIRCNKIPVV